MNSPDALQNTEFEIPEPDFTQGDADAKPPIASQEKKTLSFFTLDDVPEIFSSPWLVKGIIPLAGIGIIYGEHSSGKTFFAIDLAMTIASGQDFFGRKVKQKSVLYFCLEGKEGFMNRLAAWKKTHKEWPKNIHFNTEGFDFFELEDERIAKFPKNSVVIIDTLNATDPTLDENTSPGMGKIISRAKKFQEITGGLILLIHHCGKDATKGARGHSSLMAAVDVAILVKSNGTRSWEIDKNKDGKKGISGNFTLREVQLGVDEDGDPITSCVIEPCEAPAKALPQALQEALTSLENALAEAGTNEIQVKKWKEKWKQEYPKMRKENPLYARQKKESDRGSFNYRSKGLVEKGYVAIKQGMAMVLRHM